MASRPTAMGNTTHTTPFAQPDTTPASNEATPDSSTDDLMMLAAASPLQTMDFADPSALALDNAFGPELFDNSVFSSEEMMEQALNSTDGALFPLIDAEVSGAFMPVVVGVNDWDAFDIEFGVDYSGNQ